jgi:hypothetical protein
MRRSPRAFDITLAVVLAMITVAGSAGGVLIAMRG